VSFSIGSYFVAHISQTCLLFTLCLMVWLFTRLSARDKHLPRSFEQQWAQDKSASRTAFESTIRIVSQAPRYIFLAEKMKTFYRVDNPVVYYRHGLFGAV